EGKFYQPEILAIFRKLLEGLAGSAPRHEPHGRHDLDARAEAGASPLAEQSSQSSSDGSAPVAEPEIQIFAPVDLRSLGSEWKILMMADAFDAVEGHYAAAAPRWLAALWLWWLRCGFGGAVGDVEVYNFQLLAMTGGRRMAREPHLATLRFTHTEEAAVVV
ncbi:unnamed protein product, partial [Cladocopium goreaui]